MIVLKEILNCCCVFGLGYSVGYVIPVIQKITPVIEKLVNSF